MDTNTQKTAGDAAFRAAYPAVTQFKGRTIRFIPMDGGQGLALAAIDKGDDGYSADDIRLMLAILEGCVGPDQWRSLQFDLARRAITAEDLMQLFVKIMDRSRRDAERETATAEAPPVEPS